MAIPNYIVPQLEVFQQLDATVAATNGKMAFCLLGPQYDLYRYGHEELPPTQFTSEEQTLPFVYQQDPLLDYEVDLSSATVYAENLEAPIATFENSVKIDEDDITVLRLTGGKFFADVTGKNLHPDLEGYGVQIGNSVFVTADDASRSRIVTGIVGKRIPASVTAANVTVQDADKAPTITLTSSIDSYNAEEDTTYILQVVNVTEDAVTIQVSDSAGIDVASTLDVTASKHEDIEIGEHGITVTLSAPGEATYTVGDVFSVAAFAAKVSDTEFDGIRLNSLPVDVNYDRSQPLTSVEIRQVFNGQITAANKINTMLEVDPAGVTLKSGLEIFIPDQKKWKAFIANVGNLYLAFRVRIIPVEDEEKITITTAQLEKGVLGTVSIDNDICYAAYSALLGSAGREGYVVRTRGTDEASFLEAARKLQMDTDVYNIVPVTEDVGIARAVSLYNQSLSEPDEKKWRRTFFGAKFVGEYEAAAYDNAQVELKATFAALNKNTNSTNNNLMQLSDDNDIDLKNFLYNGLETSMKPGDKIRLSLTGEEYVIKQILSSKEALLVQGPSTEITDAQRVTFIKADTPENVAEYIKACAKSMNTRRTSVVWADNAIYNSTVIHPKYIASGIAGLASATLPQKSLTRTELPFLSSAARMYTKYTKEQLNDVASEGVLIVMQDTKGAPCYVRHNLTTETDKGILYYEESCTRNVDNLSFKVVNILDKFIGRANVTKTALRVIQTSLITLFENEMNDIPDELVGPALINYEDLTIQQHPTFKDRVIVRVKWYIPAPINHIQMYEMAFIADVTLD